MKMLKVENVKKNCFTQKYCSLLFAFKEPWLFLNLLFDRPVASALKSVLFLADSEQTDIFCQSALNSGPVRLTQ